MPSEPSYTDEETRHRKDLLRVVDSHELGLVAEYFNPKANTDQEVKVIINKMDKNQDGVIQPEEWNETLYGIFYFMTRDAFDKHCEELIKLVKENQHKKYRK